MTKKTIATGALIVAGVVFAAGSAFAQTNPGNIVTSKNPLGLTGAGAVPAPNLNSARRVTPVQKLAIPDLRARSDEEIGGRVDALGKLLTRIQAMKNLSDNEKASLASTIQTSVTDLSALKAKIDDDISPTAQQTDIKTIGPDYRIYRLVMPQVSILSAVDRVDTIVTSLQTIQTKLQARVAANQVLTANPTITAGLVEMTAKLTDAAAQATAAQAAVANLKPDQGNQAVAQSNTAALKDARAKIQAATKDLQIARGDVQTILKIIGTKPLLEIPQTTGAAPAAAR